jgi:hypothetical protein
MGFTNAEEEKAAFALKKVCKRCGNSIYAGFTYPL